MRSILNSISRIAGSCVLLVGVAWVTASAQTSKPFTEEEKALLLSIDSAARPAAAFSAPPAASVAADSVESSAPAASSAPTTTRSAQPQTNNAPREVITSIVPLDPLDEIEPVATQSNPPTASDTEASAPIARSIATIPRAGEITRYNYETGETTRTIIDPATGSRIVRVTDAIAPLAEEEIVRARALLIGAVPKIKRLVDRAREPEFRHLVTKVTDKSSPRYRKRVVLMWLVRPKLSPKYFVNLSTGDVDRFN